jgi:hypothetical protein
MQKKKDFTTSAAKIQYFCIDDEFYSFLMLNKLFYMGIAFVGQKKRRPKSLLRE